MPQPRSVIVTGAGAGIGAATGWAFAEAGDRVFLADLSLDRLTSTAAAIRSEGVSVHEVDVTDVAAVEGLVAQVREETGSIDVLVSNAGVFDAAAGIEATTHDLWARVIGINLTGTFNAVKAVAPSMAQQRSGRIIAVGSIAAQRAMPDGLAYCTSKAGIEGLIRRVAVDLGPYGVTANVVAPGVVRTDIRATSTEILGDTVPDTNVRIGDSVMDSLIPARRGAEPSEIAACIFFLASEGAAYVNGDVLHVDGGWIAS
jgi:NAD(P)-dependent dehydrogenase (short-subunit alcohol dehydrogenase family)